VLGSLGAEKVQFSAEIGGGVLPDWAVIGKVEMKTRNSQ